MFKPFHHAPNRAHHYLPEHTFLVWNSGNHGNQTISEKAFWPWPNAPKLTPLLYFSVRLHHAEHAPPVTLWTYCAGRPSRPDSAASDPEDESTTPPLSNVTKLLVYGYRNHRTPQRHVRVLHKCFEESPAAPKTPLSVRLTRFGIGCDWWQWIIKSVNIIWV